MTVDKKSLLVALTKQCTVNFATNLCPSSIKRAIMMAS